MFRRPVARHNRVWQADLSEFETTAGGSWILTVVVDYRAKTCLSCSAIGTQTARDVVVTIEAAIAEAERLMATRVIVSDNDSGYKSDL